MSTAIIEVIAATVQAVSAVVIAVLTAWLVKATKDYVDTTEEALRLSREQYERDWHPDLQIAEVLTYGPGAVVLRVANLAKPAALIKRIRIGVDGKAQTGVEPQRKAEYPLAVLVAGGQIADQIRVDKQLGLYRDAYGPERNPPHVAMWRTVLNISLVYECSGTELRTPWIDCDAQFRNSAVSNIERTG